MPFYSKFHVRIWDKLYDVLIPEQLTIQPDYIRKFGVYITEDKKINDIITNSFTQVKIPVIKILEYFENGIEIQIPSRTDMITIHKDIEAYISEWKEYIKYNINSSVDLNNNKELLLSLEKLSKLIYNKAKPLELIDNILLNKRAGIGIVNPLEEFKIHENLSKANKPDYDSIANLLKPKRNKQSRF